MMAGFPLQQLKSIADRLRIHSMRATTQAGSGHPTSCLSAADLVAALFFHAMRFDPKRPQDPRADRFVLSKGHAAPLLWAAWSEAGAIPEADLLTLRELKSNLEGHPTPRFPWIDMATGSLGQGLSVGIGLALNARLDKTNARIFVLMGDGECAEGAVWEAASLAPHYELNNLIALVDVNGLGQSGATLYQQDLASFQKKFSAFGWNALTIDGHDMEAVVQALDAACAETMRPTVILAKTEKGKGVSFLEGKEGWHGKALSKVELAQAIQEIGEPAPIKINIPAPQGAEPNDAQARIPEPPGYTLGEKVATRSGYGTGLCKLGASNPKVVALDGDTKNSTYSEKFMKSYPDRFFECFIAEQNMVGIAAGLAARGKIPFASTFAAFLTRAYDQIRMAGVSRVPIKLVGSHCGVSIGEDGPSQMALEDLAMMRAIPEAAVLYPSDAVAAERLVAEAAHHPGIVYLRMSRPALPVLYPNETMFPIGGSKILKRSEKDRATLIAAGVTLHEALAAYEKLKSTGIAVRVIDLYSIKPIDLKTLSAAAQETGPLITIEDHYPEGGLGDAVAAAVSSQGGKVHKLAVNQIPRSGKPAELLKHCGIDAESIVAKVRSLAG